MKIKDLENKSVINKHPKDWDNGYYLCYDKEFKRYVVISKASSMLHFHKDGEKIPTWSSSKSYDHFYHFYDLVGRIEDFTILDIVLEN